MDFGRVLEGKLFFLRSIDFVHLLFTRNMITKSRKLEKVSYDIRGPIYQKSQEFARQGINIIQLNIGNPAPYGFQVPDHILEAIQANMRQGQGYVNSNGILEAREAIQNYAQRKGLQGVTPRHIFIGNGVSELIGVSLQALLNPGDEILLPSPDYPLWTSTVNLCGGKPVHYLCDEQSDWMPSIADIRKKITPQTKALVVINPNNPTGAVYSKELLSQLAEIAREHSLMLLADEIYDRIVYDGEVHHAMAAVAPDVPCITYGGLSKNYMATGYRAGWMIVSGHKHIEDGFLDGLDILMSMRLCSNSLAQYGIKAALEGYQHIDDMVLPNGRLKEQRDYAYQRLNNIPGVSCVKPKGAMYMFPKLDTNIFDISSDSSFVLRLLEEEKVLVVQGTGFNWTAPDHFRITFLPDISMLEEALNRIESFVLNKLPRKKEVYSSSL
jgi:alanine-synthesizing transaminase